MPKANTYFAPAERLDADEIYTQTIKILGLRKAVNILNNLPSMIAVINQQRQVIYSNETFTTTLGIETFEEALGQRPGELLDCIHANTEDFGCGTAKDCQYCGAVLTILDAQKKKKRVAGDCRITIEKNGKHIPLDLNVIASPLMVEDQIYYLVAITDISNTNRREYLERTFIHDIINSSWALSSRIEFFPKDGLNEIQEDYFNKIKEEVTKLLDDIQVQRDLIKLENQELKPEFEKVNLEDVIQSVIHTLSTDNVAHEKKIQLAKDCEFTSIKSDYRLLRRVLMNLLKNALEASKEQEEVVIGCKIEKKKPVIWIKNNSVLKPEVKSQIFQRSFSTKGIGRGLGTYSAKLLVEEYLKGDISFVSSEKTGTIFYVKL
ncbi:MAG: PAS domain-containing sensor histidine kinase [Candidatus Heimdallarchaeota archaeon]